MGIFDQTTRLASLYAESKTVELEHRTHQLQTRLDSPKSFIESWGTDQQASFQDRRATRKQLREYHNIRVDGGLASALLEARALFVFGVGGEFTAEEDVVSEWVNSQFDALDLLALDIGRDALYYGYSLGEFRETTAGDFGKIELIEPWTTVPKVSNKGEIVSWEQVIKRRGGPTQRQEFDPDDILHFQVMKSSGRDPVGMSMLGQSMDEVRALRENQQAIQNANKLHGFPKLHAKIGREDGPVIDDNELWRYRPEFDNIHELTKWVTGQDVDIDFISPETFPTEHITEHDLSKLAISFILPIELTQISGGDGLGTGFPAKLRERLFLLSAGAQQRPISGQLVEQIGKPLLERYGPPDVMAAIPDLDDFDLRFEFGEPITDMDELESKVEAVGDDMTVNERRGLFDLAPLDDDEIGENFDSPGTSTPSNEPGLFSDIGGEQQLQDGRDNLPAQTLRWITDFSKADGSVDDPIVDWLTWMDEFDDEPSTKLNRARTAVSLFAADQGIAFEQALEQPANNLVRFLERNRNLSGQQDNRDDFWWEEHFDEISERVWHDDTDHQLFGFSEGETPAFVKAQLFEAVLEGSPIFSDVESIPDSELMDFRVFMADQLTEDGWTISDMQSEIQDRFDIDDENRAEVIARSTTQNMVSEAAEDGYKERDDFEELRFRWAGPSDHRTSDVCMAIKEGVPDGGIELDALKELVQETASDMDLSPRGWTPHPQCRHRPMRVVD